MIKIGKVIFKLLNDDLELKNLVGENIYPLVIPENTTFPCIVYERRTNPEYTKDGVYGDYTDVDITIIADTYSSSIEIAERIDTILNTYSGDILDISIDDISNTDVDETYSDGYYFQRLVYTIKSN